MLKGACIIGQSGGPTSVINASAYGVIRTALDNEAITKVYGAEHGIKGVLNDRLIDMTQEDAAELELLLWPFSPSWPLCSTLGPDAPKPRPAPGGGAEGPPISWPWRSPAAWAWGRSWRAWSPEAGDITLNREIAALCFGQHSSCQGRWTGL